MGLRTEKAGEGDSDAGGGARGSMGMFGSGGGGVG